MRRADFAKQNVLASFRFCKPPFNNQAMRLGGMNEGGIQDEHLSFFPTFLLRASGKKTTSTTVTGSTYIATHLVRI